MTRRPGAKRRSVSMNSADDMPAPWIHRSGGTVAAAPLGGGSGSSRTRRICWSMRRRRTTAMYYECGTHGDQNAGPVCVIKKARARTAGRSMLPLHPCPPSKKEAACASPRVPSSLRRTSCALLLPLLGLTSAVVAAPRPSLVNTRIGTPFGGNGHTSSLDGRIFVANVCARMPPAPPPGSPASSGPRPSPTTAKASRTSAAPFRRDAASMLHGAKTPSPSALPTPMRRTKSKAGGRSSAVHL